MKEEQEGQSHFTLLIGFLQQKQQNTLSVKHSAVKCSESGLSGMGKTRSILKATRADEPSGNRKPEIDEIYFLKRTESEHGVMFLFGDVSVFQ